MQPGLKDAEELQPDAPAGGGGDQGRIGILSPLSTHWTGMLCGYPAPDLDVRSSAPGADAESISYSIHK